MPSAFPAGAPKRSDGHEVPHASYLTAIVAGIYYFVMFFGRPPLSAP